MFIINGIIRGFNSFVTYCSQYLTTQKKTDEAARANLDKFIYPDRRPSDSKPLPSTEITTTPPKTSEKTQDVAATRLNLECAIENKLVDLDQASQDVQAKDPPVTFSNEANFELKLKPQELKNIHNTFSNLDLTEDNSKADNKPLETGIPEPSQPDCKTLSLRLASVIQNNQLCDLNSEEKDYIKLFQKRLSQFITKNQIGIANQALQNFKKKLQTLDIKNIALDLVLKDVQAKDHPGTLSEQEKKAIAKIQKSHYKALPLLLASVIQSNQLVDLNPKEKDYIKLFQETLSKLIEKDQLKTAYQALQNFKKKLQTLHIENIALDLVLKDVQAEDHPGTLSEQEKEAIAKIQNS